MECITSSLMTRPDGGTTSLWYGKPIDYDRFKTGILSDVAERIERIRREAAAYLPLATRQLTACPLCLSKTIQQSLRVYGYPYARCTECDLIFLQKRLSAQGLVEFWRDAVSGTTYTDRSVYEYRRDNVARPKLEFLLSQVKSAPGKWLDLGCGNGDLLSLARDRGWRVLGLDLADGCVKASREVSGVPVHQATLREYLQREDAEDGWDVISAIGYYDAVDDVRSDLDMVSDILAPGGLLFTLSPHHPSLSMSLAERDPERIYRYICPPGSTNFFSQKTYDYIARTYGLVERARWYCGMDVYDMMNHLKAKGKADEHLEGCIGPDEATRFQLAVDGMHMSDYSHVIYQKTL